MDMQDIVRLYEDMESMAKTLTVKHCEEVYGNKHAPCFESIFRVHLNNLLEMFDAYS